MNKKSFQRFIVALKNSFNDELKKVQEADALKAKNRAREFVSLKLDEARVIQSAKNYVIKEKAESVEA